MSEYIQEDGAAERRVLGRRGAWEDRGACYHLMVHHAKDIQARVRRGPQDIDAVVADSADRQQP